ncbi:MAG: hypothetical protein DRI57_30520 [Deltaproteobacteria bacterium]|nr:MAG: hypothetical protein DRI57_30520 [Deltaproteobacteria bacterium]
MFEAIDKYGSVIWAANIETEKRSIGDIALREKFIINTRESGLRCIPEENHESHRVFHRSASYADSGKITRVACFSHHRGEGGKHKGGSQRDHDDALFTICQLLQDSTQGDIVIKGRLGDRIANLHLFHEQTHYALEYEHTPMTEENLLHKINDYTEKGLYTIFVLNQDLLGTPTARMIMEIYDMVYFFDASTKSIFATRPEMKIKYSESQYTNDWVTSRTVRNRQLLERMITVIGPEKRTSEKNIYQVNRFSLIKTDAGNIKLGFISQDAAYIKTLHIEYDIAPDCLHGPAYITGDITTSCATSFDEDHQYDPSVNKTFDRFFNYSNLSMKSLSSVRKPLKNAAKIHHDINDMVLLTESSVSDVIIKYRDFLRDSTTVLTKCPFDDRLLWSVPKGKIRFKINDIEYPHLENGLMEKYGLPELSGIMSLIISGMTKGAGVSSITNCVTRQLIKDVEGGARQMYRVLKRSGSGYSWVLFAEKTVINASKFTHSPDKPLTSKDMVFHQRA